MYNELFQQLKRSSPQLAKMVEQDSAVMERLNEMEKERVAIELGQMLEKYFPGLVMKFKSK